ncbi:MAG: pseudouridine synthase [Saprospiraceae bacterium]
MSKYYLLYKPYGFLSQFTKEHPDHRTLAELCPDIPKDVFPVGRLDKDSEGLLLLTSDKRVNSKLLHPANQHNRTYLAQVEGIPSPSAIEQLNAGPQIKVGKQKYKCLPCVGALLEKEPELPERDPPIRVRKTVPDSWLQLTLQEGKNRQVRKMCAAVGHPVLRLLRISIEDLTLEGMTLGELREIDKATFYTKLRL